MRFNWLLGLAVSACLAAVAGTMVWISAQFLRDFNLLIYLAATAAVSLDMADLAVRFYLRHSQSSGAHPASPTSIPLEQAEFSHYQKLVHLRPYAFVVSVHNAEDELDDFMNSMAVYRERFWIVDDASTDRTCQKLRQNGWRCVEGGRNRKKPGAIRLLLQSLPPEIETVVVLDPDVKIADLQANEIPALETVIFDFQRSGMAAACPRIRIRSEGLLSRFQALEYAMAFSFGRRSLADYCITSGAAVYRRDALTAALNQHSLSVYAEDLENSILLLGSGNKIYYDARLVLETGAKLTWSGWFSQRVGWSYGLIKVYIERFRTVRSIATGGIGALYQFGFYLGIASLLLHPFRLISGAIVSLSFLGAVDALFSIGLLDSWKFAEPGYFFSVFIHYFVFAGLALAAAVPAGERAAVAVAVPLYLFYSLLHLGPVSVGYGNWLSLRLRGRRLWADHYQGEDSIQAEWQSANAASFQPSAQAIRR